MPEVRTLKRDENGNVDELDLIIEGLNNRTTNVGSGTGFLDGMPEDLDSLLDGF